MTKIHKLSAGRVVGTIDRKIQRNVYLGPGTSANVVRYKNRIFMVDIKNRKHCINVGPY